MTEPGSFALLQQKKRRWLTLIWVFGALLSISIIVGLGSTFIRLQETVQMADSLSDASYEELTERTLFTGKLGLVCASLAFLGYLVAVVMHHRAKQSLQTARDDDRHLAIMGELLEEEETED